jgi:hypothetical protein
MVLRVIGINIGVVGILVIRVLGDLLLVLFEFFLWNSCLVILVPRRDKHRTMTGQTKQKLRTKTGLKQY